MGLMVGLSVIMVGIYSTVVCQLVRNEHTEGGTIYNAHHLDNIWRSVIWLHTAGQLASNNERY